MKLYLAGGLFNAGERLHNLMLEKHLSALGHEVILPQREALQFLKDGHFNLEQVVAHCRAQATDPSTLIVVNLDGSDADSGSAVEYGMAIIARGRAVTYRSDFRTAPEKELGVNGMFHADKTIFVYKPCYVTQLEQVEDYYRELAERIQEAATQLSS